MYVADVCANVYKANPLMTDIVSKVMAVAMSQCYVIKQMVNAMACTIELWMRLGGLLSTQEARVARGDSLVRLLRFFHA